MFKRQNMVLIGAFILIIISVVIYYYNNIVLPRERVATERRVRLEFDDKVMPKKRIAVVTDDNGIPKYTEINDSIINTKIKMIDVPVKYAVKSAVTDIEQIKNKVTKEDLRAGEQISSDSISSEKKWFGDYDRLKEYEVKSIVAGECKAGNIVDIIVNYGNGDYDIVVPKTKIKKIINPNEVNEVKLAGNNTQQQQQQQQQVLQRSDIKLPYVIIIAPQDEEEYRDLELAQKVGKLETRLYLDESQPSSKKTFDYNLQIRKLNYKDLSSK